MTTDWILRIGDGENFKNSACYRIWGIQSNTSDNKHFLKNVQLGDRLWFVLNKSHGKLYAMATYVSHNKREIGPLINLTMNNIELGWCGEGPNWTSDTEIHYTDLYGLCGCDLLTHIKSPKTIRKYNPKKCNVDLIKEYSIIVKYSRITHAL